jgi:hypothetical protein
MLEESGRVYYGGSAQWACLSEEQVGLFCYLANHKVHSQHRKTKR